MISVIICYTCYQDLFIISSQNKTFFRYKEIITIGTITIEIVMLDTIFQVEIVLIKKNYSFHSKVKDDTCINSSFFDFAMPEMI